MGHKYKVVIKDLKNANRLRVLGQSEEELGEIKEALQKGIHIQGVRVLRDQLYPIKIDNANKSEVLDINGQVKEGALKALSEENEV